MVRIAFGKQCLAIQIQRPERDRSTWTGRVYDMTALVQLDEIVRMLADRGVEDPKAVIDSVLAL